MSTLFHKDLRGLLLHTTSWKAYWTILAEGKICPNRGDFKPSRPRFSDYYCKSVKGISLLDLSAVEKAYAENPDIDPDWTSVFTLRKPFTIALAVSRVNTERNLQYPSNSKDATSPIFIDPGEVCHIGDIFISEISKVFVCLDEKFVTDVTPVRHSREEIIAAANKLRRKRHPSRRPLLEKMSPFYAPENESVPLTLAQLDNL
jgi:hypothetical protein